MWDARFTLYSSFVKYKHSTNSSNFSFIALTQLCYMAERLSTSQPEVEGGVEGGARPSRCFAQLTISHGKVKDFSDNA